MDRNGEKRMIEVRLLNPIEARERISEIAALRIIVFKDFPYIYEGSLEYEVKYLGRYLEAPSARFIGAFDGPQLVGVATCLSLAEESLFMRETFVKNGHEPNDIFYFGESVLQPQFRGQGIGHRFFDLREKVARDYGAEKAAFCAVQREPRHPLKPEGYRPLDAFWKSRGYERQENLKTHFEWKDIGEKSETSKPMVFWMKELL